MSGQSQSCLSNGTERSRMHWTPLMERYFIDLMLQHLQRGNRVGHTFNKQAWTDMLTSFNANFGSQFDRDVLKARYTNLWKQFNDVKSLLSQFGFSWDAARQMVVADDDSVWDVYLKSHPDTRCYRTKPVLNFDDLCVIYGHAVADGRYSLSSHDVRLDDKLQGLHLGDYCFQLWYNRDEVKVNVTSTNMKIMFSMIFKLMEQEPLLYQVLSVPGQNGLLLWTSFL